MMNDEEKIKECYRKMYDGMIRKDTDLLKESLDETYELVHMTGVRMNRQEYIDAILNGTLNYYSSVHEHLPVTIHGNTAELCGDSRTEAAVYGGGRHTWRLRLRCDFVRREGEWKMTKSVASTY